MDIKTSILAQHDVSLFLPICSEMHGLVVAASNIKTQHQRKKQNAQNNKLNGFFDAIKHNR